jgi:integrase
VARDVGLPRSNDQKVPVFPELFDKPGPGKSGLSMSFKRLMGRAGIDDGLARKKDGKLGRNVSRLSFHSLRHTFNSAIANADVLLAKVGGRIKTSHFFD